MQPLNATLRVSKLAFASSTWHVKHSKDMKGVYFGQNFGGLFTITVKELTEFSANNFMCLKNQEKIGIKDFLWLVHQ